MKRIILFLTIIYLLADQAIQAQIDTVFWFAAPEVTQHTNNYDRPIFLRFTSYSQPATITVSQPAGTMPTQTLTLPANSSTSLNLTTWINNIENKPADQVLNYGLKIHSTSYISAYYEVASTNCNCNMDIFTLKGNIALGTDFWIPFQNASNTATANNSNIPYFPTPYSAFDIVATENNTQVTITPSNNITGHAANSTFTITLNEGQTYSAAATSALAADHLQGSRVTSNKPIAITIKDDMVNGSIYGGVCRDLGGDQIIPTNYLGTKYIVAKGYLGGVQDQIFILSTANNNNVTVNGTSIGSLSAGQQVQWGNWSGNQTAYITSDQPIYVLQVSGFGCEVGKAIIPPIECTGSKNVRFFRSSNENLYINVLVPSGGENFFTINGSSVDIPASAFNNVPFTSGQWKYAQILLNNTTYPANNFIEVNNSNYFFHLSVINGNSVLGTRFGYFSNFSDYDLNLTSNSSNNTFCVGSNVTITSLNNPQFTYNWTGPNGFTSNSYTFTLNNIQANQQGWYYLQVTTGLNCTAIDSIKIDLYPSSTPTISTNAPNCLGDSLVLNVTPSNYTNYQWAGPNAFTGNQNSHVIYNINSSHIGVYTVTVTDQNGCTLSSTINFQSPLSSIPPFTITSNTPICENNTLQLSTNLTGNNYQFNWSGPSGINGNQATLTVNNAQPSQSGNYTVLITDSYNCTATSSIMINISAQPNVNLFTQDSIIECVQNQVTLDAGNGYNQYVWSNGNNTQTINVSQSGFYTVTVTDNNNCTISDMVYVGIGTIPTITVSSNSPICSPDSLILNVTNASSNLNYSWNGPNGNYTGSNWIIFPSNSSHSGNYTVVATDNSSGCTASATINATVTNNPNTNLITQDTIIECSLNTVQLQVSGNYQSYSWSTGSTASNITVNNNGWYSISVVDNSTCKMKDSVYVSIGTLPVLNVSSNSPICEPDSLIVEVLNPNNNVNYSWVGPAGNYIGASWIISPSMSNYSGNYTVIATQSNSLCTATAQINVVVNQHPNTNLITEDTLYVCDNIPITIDAGSGYIQYIWNNGSNQSSITVDTSGTFHVIVRDNNQCKIMDQVIVQEAAKPQFYLTDYSICTGDTIVLFVSLNNAQNQYLWNNGITDSLIEVTNPGTYILTVTNDCGSTVDTSVVTLKGGLSTTFQLPNVLSSQYPDGNNDIYEIAELSNVSEFKLSIYNRWGFLLFETTDPTIKWDGKYNGNLVPAGVYFVVFDYKDCMGNSKTINSTLTVF